jgi:hypothetical protein
MEELLAALLAVGVWLAGKVGKGLSQNEVLRGSLSLPAD